MCLPGSLDDAGAGYRAIHVRFGGKARRYRSGVTDQLVTSHIVMSPLTNRGEGRAITPERLSRSRHGERVESGTGTSDHS